MTSPLLIGCLWALLLLGVYLTLPRFWPKGEMSVRRPCLLIGTVALLARLVPNCILPLGAGYDIESYQIVGGLVLRGEEVYASPASLNRHPYLPLQMYWAAFSLWSAETFRLPFVKIVKLAPIGADVGISLLLFLTLQRSGSSKGAFYSGLLYALNPIPVFVSAYHGQFDAIPALLTLLAFYWLNRSPSAAGSWLGLGILNKSWPVLAFPSLLAGTQGWRRRLSLLGLAVLIPLIGVGVYVAIFGADFKAVLGRALGYNWGVGVWGYTYFFRMLSVLRPDSAGLYRWLVDYGRYVTLAALSLVWLIRARKEALEAGFLTILVAFFALTHAFAIQYLMWLVPFTILDQEYRWLKRYTLGAFAYMFLTYNTLILEMHVTRLLPWPQADWFIIMPAGLPAWLVTVGWIGRRLFGERVRA